MRTEDANRVVEDEEYGTLPLPVGDGGAYAHPDGAKYIGRCRQDEAELRTIPRAAKDWSGSLQPSVLLQTRRAKNRGLLTGRKNEKASVKWSQRSISYVAQDGVRRRNYSQ